MYVCVCMYVCMYVYYVCMYVCMYVCVCMYTSMYVCIYVCICVCVCVCVWMDGWIDGYFFYPCKDLPIPSALFAPLKLPRRNSCHSLCCSLDVKISKFSNLGGRRV